MGVPSSIYRTRSYTKLYPPNFGGGSASNRAGLAGRNLNFTLILGVYTSSTQAFPAYVSFPKNFSTVYYNLIDSDFDCNATVKAVPLRYNQNPNQSSRWKKFCSGF